LLENLFKIVHKEETQVIVKLSDENHPIFKAHFPEYPILPGFLLIEIIAKTLNNSIKKIYSAKFISHTLPNDTIIYNIKKDGLKIKIKIVKDDEKNSKIAEITYE
jgi:3-hydroxyacyl-[acyl-carrier-protein] dehydratase